jgi:hypothetical protein
VLTAVEFDDVPFVVRRAFVVHGSDERHPRGGHDVPCEEYVVLISGTATFHVGSASGAERIVLLRERGESVLLRPGEHVSYVLDGPTSAILVLASEPFRHREVW